VDKLRHSVIRFKQLVTVTCVRSIRATDTVTPLIKPPGPSIPGFTEVTVVTAFVIFDINTRVKALFRADAYDQALIYLRESVK